jgi:hypothetical protein
MTASPPTRSPLPPPGFADWFATFVAAALDADAAREAALLAGSGAGSGADAVAATRRIVAASGAVAADRRRDREQRLAAALAATAPLVDGATLVDFAAGRIPVAAVPAIPGRGDTCYVKINHGFWEHLYALFAPYDAGRMRITDPSALRGMYVESGFLDALAAACRAWAADDPARAVRPLFGVSLVAGTRDHDEVLATFAAREADHRRVIMGAAIGLVSWWDAILPGPRPGFHDGSFPKRGLQSGALAAALGAAAADAARVVFVVPPHLSAVRLAGCAAAQETLTVPATAIHESWAACLHATVGHLLGRLAEEGSLVVITQSAVFSALLGLCLDDAKRALVGPGGRLRFFDLGQALDVAVPAAGGDWARRRAVQDDDGARLFRLAEPGSSSPS